MGAIEQVREKAALSGQWYTGQDALPLGTNLLFVLGDTKTDRDTVEMVKGLRDAGVSAEAYPRNPAYPNIYYFVGMVMGTEKVEPGGVSTLLTINPSTIEDLVPVPIALVQKKPWLYPVSPELVEKEQDIAEAMRSNFGQSYIYRDDEALTQNLWVTLRVYADITTKNLGTKCRDDLNLGTYVPDEGISGMFTKGEDWRGDGWTEILVNPGEEQITPAEIRKALGADLSVYLPQSGKGEAIQHAISGFAYIQDMIRNTGEGVSGTLDMAKELTKIFSWLGRHGKTLVWVGVGIAALWLGVKIFGPGVGLSLAAYKEGRATNRKKG